MNYDNNWLYSYLAIKTILKNDSFSIIIKSMRHFLGSVGVREGSAFTRHHLSFIFLFNQL